MPLASDRRITHLVLDTDYMTGASLSKLEEISVALLQFKKSGKPIIAVADNLISVSVLPCRTCR